MQVQVRFAPPGPFALQIPLLEPVAEQLAHRLVAPEQADAGVEQNEIVAAPGLEHAPPQLHVTVFPPGGFPLQSPPAEALAPQEAHNVLA